MNHCCIFAAVIRYIELRVELLHIISPMRMAVEEYNIFMLLHKGFKAHLIGTSLCECKVIFATNIIDKVSLAHGRLFTLNRVIKKGMEEEKNGFIAVFFKLCFKPVKLFIGKNSAF